MRKTLAYLSKIFPSLIRKLSTDLNTALNYQNYFFLKISIVVQQYIYHKHLKQYTAQEIEMIAYKAYCYFSVIEDIII